MQHNTCHRDLIAGFLQFHMIQHTVVTTGQSKDALPLAAVEGIAQIQCTNKFSFSAAGSIGASGKAEYSFCPVRFANLVSRIFTLMPVSSCNSWVCPAPLPVFSSHAH
jgi:hypothetical protein